MLIVAMLNWVLFPLTKADWSSNGVMEPDLLESTLENVKWIFWIIQKSENKS